MHITISLAHFRDRFVRDIGCERFHFYNYNFAVRRLVSKVVRAMLPFVLLMVIFDLCEDLHRKEDASLKKIYPMFQQAD